MHEDAARELIQIYERREKLISEGKLPDVPGVWERFAYCGHKVVHGYGTYGDRVVYRCVGCQCEWKGEGSSCPGCGNDDDRFQLNINRSARWRCNSCSHEWDSEDGEICPSCGIDANVKAP